MLDIDPIRHYAAENLQLKFVLTGREYESETTLPYKYMLSLCDEIDRLREQLAKNNIV